MKAALVARELVPPTFPLRDFVELDGVRFADEAFVEVLLTLRGVEVVLDPLTESSVVWRWFTWAFSHWFSSCNWMTARSCLTKLGSLRIMTRVWPVASVTGLTRSGDTSVVTYCCTYAAMKSPGSITPLSHGT